jgi:hypothetical protein
MVSLSVFWKITEPSPDKTKTNSLAIIHLGTIEIEILPPPPPPEGVKKTGLGNTVEEGRSREGKSPREKGAGVEV